MYSCIYTSFRYESSKGEKQLGNSTFPPFEHRT